MKKQFIFVIVLVFGVFAFAKAQSEQLARNYFDQGQFEKAVISYQKTLKKQPNNNAALVGLIKTYQQLEDYIAVKKLIEKEIDQSRYKGLLLVELGYNYQLQGQDSIAKIQYDSAIQLVRDRMTSAYRVGKTLEDHSLLEEAVRAYEAGMEANPNSNFNRQLARIYGELGQLEKMFDSFLNLANENQAYIASAQRNFALFISEDPTNEANIVFRKTLLKRLQAEQNIIYNELLSWLFIQQKEYKKAFTQEKAIFKRTDGNITGVIDLAGITIEANALEEAQEILEYIKEVSVDDQTKLDAEQQLLKIEIKKATTTSEQERIRVRYKALLEQYGINGYTVPIQIDYAHFLAFDMKTPGEGATFLKQSIKEEMNRFDEARLKMELADILVLQEKFNQALIYYSQIQNKIQNNVISQEARFKVARTSYYKTDFAWAEIQLDVLKSSATQLIANDALALLLVIRDNSQEDTLQTALKKYAKADLLSYQNKPELAINMYDEILLEHKGESIEDEALLAQAKLYEAKFAFAKAEKNYITIIEFYKDGILADDAYYRLAKLYEGPLQQPEKAKNNYERIIFDFADSIYYVEAQKRFRALRGDAIN
ncbi:tetratricopeptide repeat protein [uncultured Dokdonia sp.]|uniref:tetratricopeptide repeat protein n=1 Tax=uncultured Dokdonia sp. TaxID=575653 RepID=UPI00260A34A6|nr:tetratricopeptide repeat protein [uncultured Dokdonia sp.]